MSQRRLRGWQPPLENINSLVASGGPRLLARSRELVVTNGYAANACEAFASNLVGDGIKAGIVSRRKVVEATGCDVEEIDRENATDAARVAALGLRYRTSPGETQGARATPTQRPEAAANDATEQE
jgi:capsid protein